MQEFLNATNRALATENWYAALTMALTMPDICGRLEDPTAKSQARFVAWYDKYLLQHYQSAVGPAKRLHTFLSGSDFYALRCAFLHQGEFGIEDQRAQDVLVRFHFKYPMPGILIHRNQVNNTLQLQVDIFCREICQAIEKWLSDVKPNFEIQARINKLATIEPATTFGFIL